MTQSAVYDTGIEHAGHDRHQRRVRDQRPDRSGGGAAVADGLAVALLVGTAV
jgi:hypothetical protein